MIEWWNEWWRKFLHDPCFFRRSIRAAGQGIAVGAAGFSAVIAPHFPRLAVGLVIGGGAAAFLMQMIPVGEKNQSIDQIHQGLVNKGAIPPAPGATP